jgi:dTDP-4-amino-4,6-dideoxygalactose transaminase
MSEMHAAVALCSLDAFPPHLERRHEMARRYSANLSTIPGVRVQVLDDGDSSTYKDFTIAIDSGTFGCDRDTLVRALKAEGIDTRNYFDPPVHRQDSHAQVGGPDLPITDRVSSQVVSLPIYPALTDDIIDRICSVISRVHDHAATL